MFAIVAQRAKRNLQTWSADFVQTRTLKAFDRSR